MIKKIPMCPFCNHEMKMEPELSDEGFIPIKLTYPQEGSIQSTIDQHLRVSIFICDNCRFVALWRGEP